MKELQYPFDSSYLLQKKKSIKRELLLKTELLPKKIALLGGSTIGETKNMLELFLLYHGIKPEFWEGQYNRYYEEVMFDNWELKAFEPDIIYIHTTNKNIANYPLPGDSDETVQEKSDCIYMKFKQIWDKIKAELKCPIIQNNFESLPYRLMGNSDSYHLSGSGSFISRLNERFYEYARENKNFYINDLAYEAACYGLNRWFDNSMWYMYKYPFAVNAIPEVAHNIANIIKSIYGKNKKALVLDLDNTLWGGVIGDDGAENLRIGIESPEGMAYMEFQQYIKQLAGIGVSLNVCSKNDEEIALTGFEHSASILKRDDFIVFKANWLNKDSNIQEIAAVLNVMSDSLVFIDDNPVERELVKSNLSEVSVPEIGAPETYVQILDKAGFFEVTVLSEDDKKRNEYYKANQSRTESVSMFSDYKEYLKSLEMKCMMDDFKVTNIQRVTQLINKSNQFNLTTKRYTIEETEKLANDTDTICFCAQLIDKYGDNGIVSIVVAVVKERILHIDSWVMSCRVLKRDLEYAMLDELREQCKGKNISTIRGYYYKTKKNKLVEHFYETMGFTAISLKEDESIWEYHILDSAAAGNQVIEVKHQINCEEEAYK